MRYLWQGRRGPGPPVVGATRISPPAGSPAPCRADFRRDRPLPPRTRSYATRHPVATCRPAPSPTDESVGRLPAPLTACSSGSEKRSSLRYCRGRAPAIGDVYAPAGQPIPFIPPATAWQRRLAASQNGLQCSPPGWRVNFLGIDIGITKSGHRRSQTARAVTASRHDGPYRGWQDVRLTGRRGDPQGRSRRQRTLARGWHRQYFGDRAVGKQRPTTKTGTARHGSS